MNFFAAQDQARRTTRWLILLFMLSVVSLILLTELLFISVLFYSSAADSQDLLAFTVDLEPGFHIAIITLVVLVVALGSLYKSRQLAAGGHIVAEMMGGQRIPGDTPDLAQRQLLNVVEEMAIASGVPVPPVYVQPRERAINAFAAGLGTDDAIICVTQGALEALDRNALQGVMAHEFSHILNGDMRMNIMITSILHGILLLGLLGARMLRHLSFRRAGRRNGGGIVVIGVGLMAIGFGGSLFGNLIKATVNRQREYLADASAVQFTRNPTGISSALKAIGGYSYGSRLLQPNVAEFSHFFFAKGTSVWMQSLFATHPPLAQRILRLEPDWDGRYPQVSSSFTRKTMTEDLLDGRQQADKRRSKLAATVMVANTITQLGEFGSINEQHIADAREVIAVLPAALKTAARNPYHARALIYALLLSADRDVRQRQCDLIAAQAEPGVDRKLRSLFTILTAVDRDAYLPLVELALPALKSCSPQQIVRFQQVMHRLIRDDNHVSLFEWCLKTVINNNLVSTATGVVSQRVTRQQLGQVQIQVRVILSLLTQAGSDDENKRQQAYALALEELQQPSAPMYSAADLRFETVDNALKQLDSLLPLEKKRFITACLKLIAADQIIEVEEIEIVRAIAAALHCPMPPVPRLTAA